MIVGEKNVGQRVFRYPVVWIVLASAFAHLWCLNSVFFLDDIPHIRDNAYLHEGDWWRVPVFLRWTYFSYWIQTKLWGFSTVGFHCVNWGLHTAVACALYGFAKQALRDESGAAVPLIGALLFVVHPLGSEIPNYARTQDIAWVTLFSILGVWSLVRISREFSWSGLFFLGLMLAGASLSKGPGFFHAVMMIGGCAIVYLPWRRLLVRVTKKKWVVFGVFLVILLGWMGTGGMEWYGMRHWGSQELYWHGVTLCRVFWRFVALFFYPTGFSADHFIAGTISWDDPAAIPSVIGLGCWVIVAGGLIVFRKTRFLGMCLMLFSGAIVLRMLFLINEFMPEYRIYPGLPWLALAVGWMINGGLQKLRTPAWQRGASVVLTVGVVVIAGLSMRRAFVWHDLEDLSQEVLHQYPAKGRALWMLQRADIEKGNWQAVLDRHVEFEQVERAFFEESQKGVPGRELSGGHLMLAQFACLGYYAEALAATGKGQMAEQVIDALLKAVDGPGIPQANQKNLKLLVQRAQARVLERGGKLLAALQILERLPKRDQSFIDRKRLLEIIKKPHSEAE